MTRDVVVTVPAQVWPRWIAEGDLPGDPPEESGLWDFSTSTEPREAGPGSRVYVVAHGHLRGYAELVRIGGGGRPTLRDLAFVRGGGAVACTLRGAWGDPLKIRGFQGWRYAWFQRDDIAPGGFHNWTVYGVAPRERQLVQRVLAERAKGRAHRDELRRRVLAGAPLFEPGEEHGIRIRAR